MTDGVPTFGSPTDPKEGDPSEGAGKDTFRTAMPEGESATIAQHASTLISLLSAQSSSSSSSKAQRVWLGDGLGSLPKRIYDRMLKWELMDMQDILPSSNAPGVPRERDTNLDSPPWFRADVAPQKAYR